MNAFKYFGIVLVLFSFVQNGLTKEHESPFNEISLTTAKEIANAQGKYVFIDFFADWCVPCKWMDETTYADQRVINTLKSQFIPVKINIDDFDGYTLKEEYNVKVLPTVIILDASGKVVKRFEESLSPSKLHDVLTEIAGITQEPMNQNISPQQSINKDLQLNDNRTTENPVTVKTNKSYRVQVGVFTDYANTLKLVDKLNATFDQPVVIMNSYLNNKTVYKIVVGDYEKYEEANDLKGIIFDKLNIKGIIKIFE